MSPSTMFFNLATTLLLAATTRVPPQNLNGCHTALSSLRSAVGLPLPTHDSLLAAFQLNRSALGVQRPLIGGCNGTQYGCCSYPVAHLPRTSMSDQCRSQNCSVCLDSVRCLASLSEPALNATASLLHMVHSVCSDVVGPQAKQCVLVTDAGLDAIGLLERGLNATQVCSKLGFCSGRVNSTVRL